MIGDIVTSNFKLRNFKLEDAESMYRNYCSSEEVCKYLTWYPHKSVEVTRNLLEDRMLASIDSDYLLQLAITPKDREDEVMGDFTVYFNDTVATIGFVIGEDYWKKGVMSEVVEEVINYVKVNHEVTSIYGYAEVDNIASNKLFKKFHFKDVDVIYDKRKYDSDENDVVKCNLYEYKI